MNEKQKSIVIEICEYFTEPSTCDDKDCENCKAGKFLFSKLQSISDETNILKKQLALEKEATEEQSKLIMKQNTIIRIFRRKKQKKEIIE